jgi:hypothetical protein
MPRLGAEVNHIPNDLDDLDDSLSPRDMHSTT